MSRVACGNWTPPVSSVWVPHMQHVICVLQPCDAVALSLYRSCSLRRVIWQMLHQIRGQLLKLDVRFGESYCCPQPHASGCGWAGPYRPWQQELAGEGSSSTYSASLNALAAGRPPNVMKTCHDVCPSMACRLLNLCWSRHGLSLAGSKSAAIDPIAVCGMPNDCMVSCEVTSKSPFMPHLHLDL